LAWVDMPADPQGIIQTVLNWIDKPWKVAALLITFIVGGSGYVFYLHRTEIADAVLTKHKVPHILLSEFDKHANELLDSTHADLALIYSIDLESNTEELLEAVDRTGAPFKGVTFKHAVIDENTSTPVLMKMIEGRPYCFDVALDSSRYEMREAAQAGVTRECMVAVPPVIGTFIGVLAVGWKTPPSKVVEDNAQREIRAAAFQLADY
jgi:hypothetical protein